MSNPEIRKLWESFKNDSKYNRYFLSNEEEWNTIKDHQHMIKIKILKVIYFSSTFIFIDLFFLFDSVNSLSCWLNILICSINNNVSSIFNKLFSCILLKRVLGQGCELPVDAFLQRFAEHAATCLRGVLCGGCNLQCSIKFRSMLAWWLTRSPSRRWRSTRCNWGWVTVWQCFGAGRNKVCTLRKVRDCRP